MESYDVSTLRRSEIFGLAEDVGSAGHMSQGREVACDDILEAKVLSHATNKTEQARGGQDEMHVPMEVDVTIAG